MLAIGAQAPGFDTQDDQGQMVTLTALIEDGPFVLYFYPADFTPICTRQACMMRDVHADLVDAGVRVFGVSGQGNSSHEAFREKHRLPFQLLCDEDGALREAYGARGILGGTQRISYLITAEGQIGDRVHATLRLGRHADFVQRVLTRMHKSS